MKHTVLTIGHSTHSVERFINLLRKHNINAIADVRSSPFSKMNPQFNQESLKQTLTNNGIYYVFLGKELGARSYDPDCYINDKVQYEKLKKTNLFLAGIDRILDGSKSFHIALMCAEKEPLDCHRTILVSRELVNKGLEVMHILSDGSIEPHDEALKRLMSELKISSDDMFLSNFEIQNIAYKKQAEKIAYVRKENKSEAANRAFDSKNSRAI